MGVRARAALRLIFAISILTGAAVAQLARYDGFVAPAGYNFGPATIAVCQSGGSGGPPCTPLALVYSDPNGTSQIQQPFSADMNGHYYFYAPAGAYVTDTYGSGYATTLTNITLGSTVPSLSGSNTWTGAQTFGVTNLPGPIFNPKSYGAKGDAKSIIDGVTTSASTTMTSATANFSQADVGKILWCINPTTGNLSTGTAGQPATSLDSIASVQSATSITLSVAANTNAGSGQMCVYGTQDDTSAINSASNAAIASAGGASFIPQQGPGIIHPGTVYVPAGGYIVSGPIFNFASTTRYSVAPNFRGEGRGQTVFYVAPTFNMTSTAVALIRYADAADFTLADFSVWGADALLKGVAGGQYGLISLGDGGNGPRVDRFVMRNVEINNIGFNQAGGGVLGVYTGENGTIDSVYIQQGAPNSSEYAAYFVGSSGITILNSVFSNHFKNLYLNNVGANIPQQFEALYFGFQVIGGFDDECGATSSACLVVDANSVASFYGVTMFGNTTDYAAEVDGVAYFNNVDAGTYLANASGNGVHVASGGTLYSSGSVFHETGASNIALTNAGTVFDLGGNRYLNCVQNGSCSTATLAQTLSGTAPWDGSLAVPFASAPACASGLEGHSVSITDSNTVVFNATIAGSGTNHVRGYCNGTNLVVY